MRHEVGDVSTGGFVGDEQVCRRFAEAKLVIFLDVLSILLEFVTEPIQTPRVKHGRFAVACLKRVGEGECFDEITVTVALDVVEDTRDCFAQISAQLPFFEYLVELCGDQLWKRREEHVPNRRFLVALHRLPLVPDDSGDSGDGRHDGATDGQEPQLDDLHFRILFGRQAAALQVVPEHQSANAHEGDGDDEACFLPDRQTFGTNVVPRRQKLPQREPGVKPGHGDGDEQKAAHDADREVVDLGVEFGGANQDIEQARNEDDQQDAGPDALVFGKSHMGVV